LTYVSGSFVFRRMFYLPFLIWRSGNIMKFKSTRGVLIIDYWLFVMGYGLHVTD